MRTRGLISQKLGLFRAKRSTAVIGLGVAIAILCNRVAFTSTRCRMTIHCELSESGLCLLGTLLRTRRRLESEDGAAVTKPTHHPLVRVLGSLQQLHCLPHLGHFECHCKLSMRRSSHPGVPVIPQGPGLLSCALTLHILTPSRKLRSIIGWIIDLVLLASKSCQIINISSGKTASWIIQMDYS